MRKRYLAIPTALLATAGLAAGTALAQLDDGSDVSVYDLVHSETGESQGRWAVFIDADGTSHSLRDFTLTPRGEWRSVRTFECYPTSFNLEVPGAKLSLTVDAEFPDQELVTVISKPAFWEGRCKVAGTRDGKPHHPCTGDDAINSLHAPVPVLVKRKRPVRQKQPLAPFRRKIPLVNPLYDYCLSIRHCSARSQRK